ncbi:unnamed protein product [Tuber melanosporum]|uniref:(Perigord truffle) hypothetical protein n=1 Tax=Tuber melanosporum (strain Mel28) TaxID=656061 RepID=D5GLP6_TUBMM|nr:uncharacterized protein GSTUM_00010303001 [Tuber melanosporum]CAZ85439.1 unnamed protein product [Tuber melanosporum]
MAEGRGRLEGQCSRVSLHGNAHQGPQHPNTDTPRSLLRLVPSGKPLLLALFLLLLLSTPVPVAAKTHFAQCGAKIKELAKNGSLPSEYIYTGPVKGPLGQARNSKNPAFLVTFAACEEYCGVTPEYYEWEKASDTITTWVLPLVGLILQAPFESNNFKQTMFVVFRWVGSPIVSMMCIFWNMKVTRKCAIMVDMSVDKDQYPPPPSSFAELRDSFYLLSVVNQYELNIYTQLQERHIETILRVGLFDRRREIQRMRARVAASIRRERRRGTVQVLASLAWFLVAMGISINKAFGDLGVNSTAHNLALGLLMSWLPVLIAATIVDRNPMDARYVRAKLNNYLREIEAVERTPSIFPGVEDPDIFGEFAGQGRVRWHYGVAHSFLRTLEAMHGMGRGWSTIYENTDELSTTGAYSGLVGFDLSEVWQMVAAFLMVCSCSLGAFFVSYYTPTVGLGCRSGGYMIFGLNATGCLILEMAAWAFLHPGTGRRMAQWVLRLCEFTNFCWLVYIIVAQTFGIYNSCRCKSSMWGGAGGYVDFEGVPYYKSYHIENSWLLGTLTTCIFLGIGLAYVVEQWCTQSFLWTQNWESAMNGLWCVRKWKWATTGPRWVFAWLAEYVVEAECRVRTFLGREGDVEDCRPLWNS